MSIAKKAAPPHARVSVIIPARNARQSIGETLGSLVSETPLIEEILLVDDSSTDGTASFAEAEGKRLGLPVRVLQAGARGTGAARNAGLDAALAPFIYFIDADDLLAAGGLTALKDRLDANPDSGLALGTYVRNVDGKRERIERPAGYSSSKAANARGIIEGLSPSIAIGSILIRRNVIGKVRFPEGIAYDEDTIFFAAVLADTPVVFTENIVCVYNVNSERSESRFSIRPQKTYLDWRRALQPLLGTGLDRKVIKRRQGLLALKIARIHYARRDRAVAAKFVRLALAAPLRLRDRIRAIRYRMMIDKAKTGRRADAATLRPRARPAVPATVSPTSQSNIIVTVDPAWPPVSGADLRNWNNALASIEFAPTRLISLGALRAPETEVKGIQLLSLSQAHAGEIYRRPTNGSVIDITIPPGAIENLRFISFKLLPTNTVVETLLLHPLLGGLRPLTKKLVLDLHNVESDLVRQSGGILSSLFGRTRRNVERIRAIEKSAASAVDEFWTCSEIDADRLRGVICGDTPIHLVPNAIPRLELVPESRPERNHSETSPRLLFLGHLAYTPNLLAAKILARSIFPALRSQFPEAQLVLAGRNPRARANALAGNGVEVVANPVDASGLLATADFVVLPITIGGGTRIKAIEAMAWGIPVVASKRAVEGLGLIDRVSVRFAETPRQFCEAIGSLWSDPVAYRAQRDAARQHAFARFGPEAIAKAVRASFAGTAA